MATTQNALNPIVSVPSFSLGEAPQTEKGAVKRRRVIDPAAWHGRRSGLRTAFRGGNDAPEDPVVAAMEGTNAFALGGFLSQSECEYIIETAKGIIRPLNHLYCQRVRKADRAMIRSPTVASQLYHRILPHLEKSDYVGRSPLCFGHDGVWAPFGLNECLKVFRYAENGAFIQHRDGPWVPRMDQCSMYTIIIYLNDNFEGGNTALYGSSDSCQPQGMRTSYDLKGWYVVPTKGTALLFNHDCWHAGERIIHGEKWILRTELIFQRVYSFYVDKNAFASSALYLETRRLYDESMAASERGDRDTFFTLYQQVVARQREAMVSEGASRKPRLLAALGLEELSQILSFISLGKDLVNLLCINRQTYTAIVHAPFWQDKWEAEVKEVGSNVPLLASDPSKNILTSLLQTKESLINAGLDAASDTAAIANADPHGFYYGRYRQRVWMRRQCAPSAILLLSSGPVAVAPHPIVARSTKEARYCNATRTATFAMQSIYSALMGAPIDAAVLTKRDESGGLLAKMKEVFSSAVGAATGSSASALPDELPAGFKRSSALCDAQNNARGFAIYRMPRCYGGWRYAYPYHMNQPNGEKWTVSEEADARSIEEPKFIVHRRTGAVEWSILSSGIDDLLEANDSPLLIVTHPRWGQQQPSVKHCGDALNALFETTRVPAVCFVHPAVCAAVGFLACYRPLLAVKEAHMPPRLVIELQYGGIHKSAEGEIDRYRYVVNTETFTVESGISDLHSTNAQDKFIPDVILGDCEAFAEMALTLLEAYKTCKEQVLLPQNSQGYNRMIQRVEAMLSEDAATASSVSSKIPILPLPEVLAYGSRVLMECPSFVDCLTYWK